MGLVVVGRSDTEPCKGQWLDAVAGLVLNSSLLTLEELPAVAKSQAPSLHCLQQICAGQVTLNIC